MAHGQPADRKNPNCLIALPQHSSTRLTAASIGVAHGCHCEWNCAQACRVLPSLPQAFGPEDFQQTAMQNQLHMASGFKYLTGERQHKLMSDHSWRVSSHMCRSLLPGVLPGVVLPSALCAA